jgi:hypothetical protein
MKPAEFAVSQFDELTPADGDDRSAKGNVPMLLAVICVALPLGMAGGWHLVAAILKVSAP